MQNASIVKSSEKWIVFNDAKYIFNNCWQHNFYTAS